MNIIGTHAPFTSHNTCSVGAPCSLSMSPASTAPAPVPFILTTDNRTKRADGISAKRKHRKR